MMLHVARMTGGDFSDSRLALGWLYAGGKDGDDAVDTIDKALNLRKTYNESRGLTSFHRDVEIDGAFRPYGWTVTKSAVFMVCDSLQKEGEVPTLAAVAYHFDTPANRYIGQYIDEWRAREQVWVAAQQNPTVPMAEMIRHLQTALRIACDAYSIGREITGLKMETLVLKFAKEIPNE